MRKRRNISINVPLGHEFKQRRHRPCPRCVKPQVTRNPLGDAGDEQRLQVFDPVRGLVPLGGIEENGSVAAGAGVGAPGGEGGGGGGDDVRVVRVRCW